VQRLRLQPALAAAAQPPARAPRRPGSPFQAPLQARPPAPTSLTARALRDPRAARAAPRRRRRARGAAAAAAATAAAAAAAAAAPPALRASVRRRATRTRAACALTMRITSQSSIGGCSRMLWHGPACRAGAATGEGQRGSQGGMRWRGSAWQLNPPPTQPARLKSEEAAAMRPDGACESFPSVLEHAGMG
jgi:hypothetical protein